MLKMNLIFYHSTKRLNGKGTAPIYGRITIRNRPSDFSTGIFVAPGQFENGIINGSHEMAVLQNAELSAIRAKAYSIYLDKKYKDRDINATQLKNIITGAADLHTTFLSACDQYYAHYLTRQLKDCSNKKTDIFRKHVEAFLKATGRADLYVDEFDISVAEEYRQWLPSNVLSTDKTNPAGHDHYSRCLKFCRATLKLAVKKKLVASNALIELQASRSKTKEVVALDVDEYQRWMNYAWVVPVFKKVQALYLFQCNTGISYGDFKCFVISTQVDGREWIACPRDKGGKLYTVELNSTAKGLIEAWGGTLPYLSNAEYNRVLKEMAAQLGITKKLTTHTARKTFSDIKYLEGYSESAISLMMGNTVQTCEKYYRRPNIKRIIAERNILEAKSPGARPGL